MTALQENSTAFNPNNLELTLIASYDRLIRANITRVWENVLDWEHLPQLHGTSFGYVSLDEAGDWGWRTWSNPGRTAHIELCVDKTHYVARSYDANKQTSEIWTYLTPEDEQTGIHVEFHATNIKPEAKDKVGKIYLRLYEQLWDEDEAMMMARQLRLTESRNKDTELNLGSSEQLRSRLPITVQLKNSEFRLIELNGKLVLYSTICPHRLGPLIDADICDNSVTCPWHGYCFDINTGKCLSPAESSCKLPEPPTILEESGNIILRYQEFFNATS